MSVLSLREAQERRDLSERLAYMEAALERIEASLRDRSALSHVEPFVSRQTVAEKLGVSARWLDPFLKGCERRYLAGKFVYRLSDVEAHLQAIGELDASR